MTTPSDKIGEPDYRYYNCNLQAPKIKAKKITCEEIEIVNKCIIERENCIYDVYEYDIEIPELANDTFSGKMEIYLKNITGAGYMVYHIRRQNGATLLQELWNVLLDPKQNLTTRFDTHLIINSPTVKCDIGYKISFFSD